MSVKRQVAPSISGETTAVVPFSTGWLKQELDDCLVSQAAMGRPHHYLLDGYLPPRLWEPLRQRLQDAYRRATGETHATLIVETSDG